jgi:hypothetical protein
MSKKRKVTVGDPARSTPWTRLELVTAKPNPKARATDPEGYDALQADYDSGRAFMYKNSLYTCHLRMLGKDMTQALWISIRHNDRKAIRDWRHFQRIKNELAGVEREAVEIYPKESQLVDEANTYHLWVLAEADVMPFGFKGERMVSSPEAAEAIGAKQRPFDE